MEEKKKILLVSSSGGHFEQLLRVHSKLKEKYDISICTEKTAYNSNKNYYYLKQINRKSPIFPFLFIINWITSKKIINKVKPDVIISFGALATIPICLIGRKKNTKVIFIESFAKINSATMTGKFLYKRVRFFIIQWPELKAIYPEAIYLGGVY